MGGYSSYPLVLIVTLFACAVNSEIFHGNGEVFFTTEDSYSGFRVIYMPEDYTTYSAVGYGHTAYIRYVTGYSEHSVTSDFNEQATTDTSSGAWKSLTWNSKGKYYYYDTYYKDIEASSVIVFGVQIKNREEEIIYIVDGKVYNVPEEIIYCELDDYEYGSSSTTYCSKALKGEFTADDDDDDYTIAIGSTLSSILVPLIVSVVIVIVVLAISVWICRTQRCFFRASNVQIAVPSVRNLNGATNVSYTIDAPGVQFNVNGQPHAIGGQGAFVYQAHQPQNLSFAANVYQPNPKQQKRTLNATSRAADRFGNVCNNFGDAMGSFGDNFGGDGGGEMYCGGGDMDCGGGDMDCGGGDMDVDCGGDE